MERERSRAKVRMASLEKEVDAMRNAQLALKKRMKESGREHDIRVMSLKKEQAALRKDLDDSRKRVARLEADNERQRSMLQKKSEEAARHQQAAKEAKLRSAPSSSSSNKTAAAVA
eukprot:scaffold319511_cov30-Prasinocladus_malaysianus.AAC.1